MAITKKETSYTLSLDIPSEIKGEDRDSLLADISEFLVSDIIAQVESGHSPVGGFGEFSRLNKTYASQQKNGDDTANLDLHGDMLNALTSEIIGRNKIKVGISGEQAIKSYAHNTGFKGHKKIKSTKGKDLRRPFIPDIKLAETFDKEILKGIKELIAEKLAEVKDG
jgi:hypothetical protein